MIWRRPSSIDVTSSRSTGYEDVASPTSSTSSKAIRAPSNAVRRLRDPWIVEYHLVGHAVRTATVATEALDGFRVVRTKNYRETLQFYVNLSAALKQRLDNPYAKCESVISHFTPSLHLSIQCTRHCRPAYERSGNASRQSTSADAP